MASEREMADSACRATGDEILVAGLFTPRHSGHGLVVAVSPTRVYLLHRSHRGDGPDHALTLAHTFDRRRGTARAGKPQTARGRGSPALIAHRAPVESAACGVAVVAT